MGEKCIIPLGSVTYAMKAQRLLNARSVFAEVTRADSHNTNGCGYGVSVNCREMDAAVNIIKKSGIRIIGGR